MKKNNKEIQQLDNLFKSLNLEVNTKDTLNDFLKDLSKVWESLNEEDIDLVFKIICGIENKSEFINLMNKKRKTINKN